MTSRREFLYSVSAMAATSLIKPAAVKSYGIAFTSFPVRMRQAREAADGPNKQGPPIPAEKFIDLCQGFSGDGCQMDFSQLASTDAEYLKRLRAGLDAKGMYMELAVSARLLDNEEEVAKIAAAANQLGVSILRVACLSGRRYESFHEMAKWKDFVAQWNKTLEKAAPILKKHKLVAGVENHKDWLADEQVEMLKRIGSENIGACVDFGNNVSLLEDPLEVAEKLAPYAVTTHLKDMAVRPYDEGFELSEVALGDGATPLAKIISTLRKHRGDIHIVLEMITRDPLKVPYKTDHYWITHERRDEARIRKFENTVLNGAWTKPLPRVTGLGAAEALAFEDENLRRSAAYAKQTLKL
ncbi:MAG TPA: TIM barrel protein [Blastocatellia bacterium]|jgi:sugar phosphate isomerase/epimerase|nr:TIM barrel protein [Blastocatellia bacterium]